VAALLGRLEVAIKHGEAVTRSRQHNPTAAEQPKQSTHGIATGEQIGSRMVSAILGRSPRWVHRHATDLHGRRVGRQYIFPAAIVHRYAAQLNGGNDDG